MKAILLASIFISSSYSPNQFLFPTGHNSLENPASGMYVIVELSPVFVWQAVIPGIQTASATWIENALTGHGSRYNILYHKRFQSREVSPAHRSTVRGCMVWTVSSSAVWRRPIIGIIYCRQSQPLQAFLYSLGEQDYLAWRNFS